MMSQKVNQQILAHLQNKGIAIPEPLPDEFIPVLDQAQRFFLQGQLRSALATLENIPNGVQHIASVVILHVRILLQQGFFHDAVRVLKHNIHLLGEKRNGSKREEHLPGDEMQRETWQLWIRLCFWDDEGMNIDVKSQVARKAYNAWKIYLELKSMDDFTELDTLLYEIIHYLGVGTCDLPPREWTQNTDALISFHMDSQNFVSVLAILRVRNYVLGQADPTFSNIMLEYFPNLSFHQDSKFLEARTRLILYHIYINAGDETQAYQQLMDIDDCLRMDEERQTSELKWLVKFYRASMGTDTNRNATDHDKLARLDALASEATSYGYPEFKLKALNAIVILLLKLENYDDFIVRERDLLQQASKYGQLATSWRAHLKSIPENLPPPDHPRSQGLITELQAEMERISWNQDSEMTGEGPVGVGLGMIVWNGLAEMLVGIQEMWKAKAAILAQRLVEEERLSGNKIDEGNLSRGLRKLIESSRQV